MTTTTLPIVGGPGVYDIPADVYHADPVPGGSLSSTGARKLLPPSCPALFRHWLDHGQATKKEFDLGHAAHREVLGVGSGVVLVDRARWDTNEVKAQLAEIRAAGKVPLKRAEYEQVQAMAAKLREHPIAGHIFTPERGKAEQTLIWTDSDTGITCRAMLDHLPDPVDGRRLIVADYKTCLSAAPADLPRVMEKRGYYIQAPWYLDGVTSLGLAPDGAAFVFVFQEKTEPYLVTVVQLPEVDLDMGRTRMRQARRLYADCMASGRWPGYSDDIEFISLPAWFARDFAEENQ